MSEGCASCRGACCRDVVVRVSMFDMWRISRALALPFCELVDPCSDDTCGDGSLALDASGDRYLPVLRRAARDDSACAFLMRVGDVTSRCGIYAARPEICDAYPFELVRGAIDLRSDVRCEPDAWNFATLDYRALRTRHERYLDEWDAHARATAVFSYQPGARDVATAFARYLALCETLCERTVVADDGATRTRFALEHIVELARDVVASGLRTFST